MQVSDFLSADRIACDIDLQSKKKALEQLSELLTREQTSLNAVDIFDSLLSRERLGATGLGHGIALPHGRIKNCTKSTGALLRLKQGVDFDAIDGQPVDLLFALIVPEESTDEHLQILSMLASMFSNADLRKKLRSAGSADSIFQLLTEWQAQH